MTVYERLGRALEAYDAEVENHRTTVALLGRVVSGELAADRVVVSGDSWRILPESDDGAEIVPLASEVR